MTITVSRSTAARRIGVFVFSGLAAALVGLGASGSAAAVPPPPGPFLPAVPDNPRGPLTVNSVVRDWGNPPPPPVPWDAPPPAEADLGDTVSLNPQPLSPGPDRGRRVGLNPQPLPPGPDLWFDLPMLPRF
jgi:hypothetical protein